MRIIINPVTDAYFNLASEEYLLRHEDEDVFLLWRNDSTVVIGRNQNTWAEVNVPYVQKNGIAVVRRLSGGGAVFHDLGNVNFTFITSPGEAHTIDFGRFTAPVIRALAALGVRAEADGRNDILADGAKISGNAQCVFRRPDGTQRLLHHGTLLFGADLSRLADALVVRPEKLRAKGVTSVRRRVTNLRDIPGFPAGMSVEEFIDHLSREASGAEGAAPRPFTPEETDGIRALREEKYATWEWNYGASGEHETEYFARFPFGGVSAAYTARHGALTRIRLWGDYFGTEQVSELEEALTGAPLRRDALTAAALSAPHPVGDYIAGADADTLVSLLLGELQ